MYQGPNLGTPSLDWSQKSLTVLSWWLPRANWAQTQAEKELRRTQMSRGRYFNISPCSISIRGLAAPALGSLSSLKLGRPFNFRDLCWRQEGWGYTKWQGLIFSVPVLKPDLTARATDWVSFDSNSSPGFNSKVLLSKSFNSPIYEMKMRNSTQPTTRS